MSGEERGGAEPSAPLLTIKLVPPVLTSRWLPRPEVVERLVGADAQVLLITAPAGWGKTSLLAAWLDAEQGRRPAAYLRLEESDDAGPVFWTYAVAALRRAWPELALGAEDALRSPDVDPMRDFFPSLLNELTEAEKPVLLVLDDYHAISREAIHRSVGYLIDHLPHGVQLAIATRTNPRLRLGRLRASGKLMELRAHDLAFSAFHRLVSHSRHRAPIVGRLCSAAGSTCRRAQSKQCVGRQRLSSVKLASQALA